MLASLLLVMTAVQVPLVSSLLFTCNPKQLARLSTLLASFTTTVSSSSLLCACEHQVGNELYRTVKYGLLYSKTDYDNSTMIGFSDAD